MGYSVLASREPLMFDNPSADVHRQVVGQSVYNIVVMGIGTILILWIKGFWLLGAKVIFVGALLISVLDVIQLVKAHRLGSLAGTTAPETYGAKSALVSLRRAEYWRWSVSVCSFFLLLFLFNRLWF